MKKTRAVHYSAAGSRSYVTDCYREALRRHLDSGVKQPDDIRPGHYHLGAWIYSVPVPRRHTDLTKVTCDRCWREIIALGARHFAGAWRTIVASTLENNASNERR